MTPRKRQRSTAPKRKPRIALVTTTTAVTVVIAVLIFFTVSSRGTLHALASSVHEIPGIGQIVPASWAHGDLQSQVLPSEGFQTNIVLGDVVPKLLEAGVIDIQKVEANYADRGGIPPEMEALLTSSSLKPMRLTKQNSSWLITLLWPLGLSNRMTINEQSPIVTRGNVAGFASTGGWTLGKEDGGSYFNSSQIVPLTAQQESRVQSLAETIFRPCCNNSSFFQDCNHGSAALGLIELAVSQGLPDDEIYRTVLHFNSFWFPQQYLETATYFQSAKGMQWDDIDPKLLLSKDYSSITGWTTNVDAVARKTPGLIPTVDGGSSCAI